MASMGTMSIAYRTFNLGTGELAVDAGSPFDRPESQGADEFVAQGAGDRGGGDWLAVLGDRHFASVQREFECRGPVCPDRIGS